MMRKVTGLGGIFVKYHQPEAIRAWYNTHLGLNTDKYGTSFETRDTNNPDHRCFSVWSTFAQDTDYFLPSVKEFMINLRVADLEGLLKDLALSGIHQTGEMQVHEYGKFAHIMDPEGVKIELWEPNDVYYGEMAGMYVTK